MLTRCCRYSTTWIGLASTATWSDRSRRVADQLATALGKFGLTAFGDVGDPFDPTLHEAVAHMSSPDVTETTCVEIMRRGYLLGERLLRPALVAVADPE